MKEKKNIFFMQFLSLYPCHLYSWIQKLYNQKKNNYYRSDFFSLKRYVYL